MVNDEPKEHWCKYAYETHTKALGININFVESFNSVCDSFRGNLIFSNLKRLGTNYRSGMLRSKTCRDLEGTSFAHNDRLIEEI